MTKKSPTIVFFGSGPVAAESLKFIAQHFRVEAVVTKRRAAHHKDSAPVEEIAREFGQAIYFANNKNELEQLINKRGFQSSLGIVVDYGVIMSMNTINAFELGIINSHFSLLPQWRGADPITFSILSGQTKTGVSLMKIVPALDEGQLISQESLPISSIATTPELTEQLILLSNKMLARDIPKYILGELRLFNQPNLKPSYSRKLTKEDGIVDWSKPAEVIEREIRAYLGWPKCLANIGSHRMILKKASVVNTTGASGDFIVSKKNLVVYCGEKALSIESLQPLGKKEMPIEAFLAGNKL